MAGQLQFFVALVLFAIGVTEIDSSAETMKNISSGFIKVLDECKQELNLGEHILNDFYHFWKEEYSLLNRETGCAIICMSKKLDLLDPDGNLHHGNAKEFAMKHGAEDEVASKLITLIHECEKQHTAVEDECLRKLEVAKCFRSGIHQLNWAPNMDVIVTEVLTEM
uniref:Pheromone-binding protein 3 n=1 Tax=Streltzoviella insularis TaxID=1206366 RepID=A0A7D5YXT5_9NEOP|nr:pheromone-binding protein 3 [Streltzoviella insularis]